MTRLINLLIILLTLFSCSINSIISEPMERKNDELISTKVGDLTLHVNIINKTENVLLKINTCEICNIRDYYGHDVNFININLFNNIVLYPSDTLSYNGVITYPQLLKPWNPLYLPSIPNNYIKIHGSLYIDGYEISILKNEDIYIPISGNISYNTYNTIDLELISNCPWYYYNDNNEFIKILNPIEFECDTNEWVEINNVIIIN